MIIKKRCNICISDDTKNRLKSKASKLGLSVSAYIELISHHTIVIK